LGQHGVALELHHELVLGESSGRVVVAEVLSELVDILGLDLLQLPGVALKFVVVGLSNISDYLGLS
jgi:hypothetical protein